MDKFDKVVRKNIFSIEGEKRARSNKLIPEKVIKISVSSDMFPRVIEMFGVDNLDLAYPVSIDVYDEGTLSTEEFFMKETFIGVINRLPIEDIRFHLSDEQFSVYNVIMAKENWKHEDKTQIHLTIDRHPLSTEAKKKMEIENCLGKLYIPEEKLIWFTGKSLTGARSSLGTSRIEEVEALKKVVANYADSVSDTYDMKYMDAYALTQITSDFIREHVHFPHRYIQVDKDGKQTLKPGYPEYIFSSYGTLRNREGVCTGQTKLMQAFLSNKYFNIDSSPILGYSAKGRHEWLGVEIGGILFHCCPTVEGPFIRPKEVGYEPDEDNIYTQIYKTAYLTNDDREKAKEMVKKLKLTK